MKKIILIALVLINIGIGCKKEEKSTSTGTTPVTSYFTADDSLISGDWILDISEVYYNGSLLQSTPHNDPINCHLNLKLEEHYPNVTPPQPWKNAIYGISCANYSVVWKREGNVLTCNASFTIVSLTSTNLILQIGSTSSSGGTAQKFYLHK